MINRHEVPRGGWLIDATSLARELGNTLVIDCRFDLFDADKGPVDYRAGHIPGAVYADLNQDLSNRHRRGRGRRPLPFARDLAHTLASWGWVPGRPIVIYDAAGGSMAAARLWWLLRAAGISARLLDGGWRVWLAQGLDSTAAVPAVTPAVQLPLRFDPAFFVDYREVETLRLDPYALIIDARSASRFRGDSEPLDAAAGHIPGARNRPVASNILENGRFKPAEQLRQEFQALLQSRPAAKTIHMCGSGVFACQSALAMELAGLSGSRVFVPSWSGWSSVPGRALATGD